jgi:beta-phosphoglucomutase-like phosphatase (HAD superfamily)
MVKALILDLDGTLIDSHKAHIKSYQSVFESRGLIIDRSELEKHFGKVAEDIIKSLFPKLTKQVIKLIIAEKQVNFLNHLSLLKPLACANKLLSFANRKYSLAIATSMSRVEMLAVIKQLGWSDYFKALVSSYDVKNPKPAPDILFEVINQLSSNNDLMVSDCLFVGDSVFDAQCSLSAGVPFIGVATGTYSRDELGVNSVANLCELMKKIRMTGN